MAREPIHAAGGIVMRGGARPRIAVVRRSKDDHWVLPRGKLKREENPIVGAKREVVEETGHRVKVHEFLGAITYSARGRPKLVQFWRMQAAERPSHDLTEDIDRGALASAQRGDPALKFSAGEAVSAQRRAPGPQTPSSQGGTQQTCAAQSGAQDRQVAPENATRAAAEKDTGAAPAQKTHRAANGRQAAN